MSILEHIKLGQGGDWSHEAFGTATLPFGHRTIGHDMCAAGDWQGVREALIVQGGRPAARARPSRIIPRASEVVDRMAS